MNPGLVYYVLDATRRLQYLKIGFTTDLKKRVADFGRYRRLGSVTRSPSCSIGRTCGSGRARGDR